MIELKNSRTEYLGKASGKERYSLDAFIGAVQMREPEGQWQDIKPRLVREADGWYVAGAPYHAEIKDDGSRLFCPDKNERSKYLRLPGMALFSGLSRNVVSNPIKLDNLLLPNQITMPTEWGEIRIIFSNTGMHFEILFREAPPANVFGKDSPKILLDAETVGYDIEQLLKSTSGIGIPKPRLRAANIEALMSNKQDKWLEWSYKNGQLELGFDFGDLPFPILLKNTTIDVQVGAGANDGHVYPSSGFDNTNATIECGRDGTLLVNAFHRWTGITIPQSSTINVCWIELYETSTVGSPLTNLYFEKANNPGAVTSYSDYFSRTLTTAYVAWDGDPGAEGWHYSPSLVTPMQELINAYGLSNQAIQLFHKDDGSSTNNFRKNLSWNYSGNIYGAWLYIEYTAGGATAKTAAETGAGADVRNSLAAAVTRTESGGGTDARQSVSVSLTRAESGGGADTRLSLLAGMVKGDSGTGAEQSLLSSLIFLLSSDAGAGLDATVTRLAMILKTDSGSGIEGIYGRSLSRGESGSGADARLALLAAIAKGETGSGIEQSLLASFVARLAAETGQGSDTAGLIARLAALESGSGVDAGWLVGLKNILAGDLGTGYEALQALIGTPGAGSDMKLPGRAGQVRIPSKGVSL